MNTKIYQALGQLKVQASATSLRGMITTAVYARLRALIHRRQWPADPEQNGWISRASYPEHRYADVVGWHKWGHCKKLKRCIVPGMK